MFSQGDKRVWRSTFTSVLEEAKQVFAELSRDYVSHKKLTILQFRAQLIALFESDYAPGTLAIYDRALKSLANILGDRPIQSVSVLQVDIFKSRRLKQVKDTTVNIEFRTLKAAFNHALKYDFIEENPFMRTRNVILPDADTAFLTKDQFLRLLAVVDNDQMRSIILLAVYTGMRRGEIVNLKWADVHPEERLIRFTNRNGFVTKSKRPRTIYLKSDAIALLAGLPRNAEYVFPKFDGRKLCAQSVSRLFKKYVRKAGIAEEIHLHSLRHTAVTWLIDLRMPVPYVKKLMDHSRIETTMRYTHVDTPHLLESLEATNGFLNN